MIELHDYDLNWPIIYQAEAEKLSQALGKDFKEIYHIGSTAIPGMRAKPVIDILLGVHDIFKIDKINDKLAQLGYEPVTRQIVPHVSFFTKKYGPVHDFHLHLHEVGSPQIKRHVHFRDYLIYHQDEAKVYAELKNRLADQFKNDRFGYVLAKSHFVQQIDGKAKKWEGRRHDFCEANSGPQRSDWDLTRVLKAAVANFNCQNTHFPQFIEQVELIRVPGYTLINSNLPDDTFNLIIDAHLPDNQVDSKIEELTRYFTDKNIDFSWWLGPTDQPINLDAHLEQARYQNMETNPVMYFDLDSWQGEIQPHPELEIVQATDENQLIDYASVLMNDEKSFKQYYSWIASVLDKEDPFEYYVGYVNGVPVVRGMSCYFAQVVGLYWLSTAVDQRNKGYGRAMQEYRLKRAKDKNYHLAVLQASKQGYPLYAKMGYQVIAEFKDYHLISH